MILNREQFINEIYNPMMEQKEYEQLVQLNEGLLKQLFGRIRNLFKNDWNSIKGDKTIIKVYKELDDKLTGFSTMKLEKRDQCNKIRQELVNFAVMWYEQKLDNAKKNDADAKIAKSMEFKDETLKDGLEKCQKIIKEVAEGDGQLNRWANILMDDMTIVINQSILNDIEDEETKKEIEKENEKQLKKSEDINKKMEKFQNDQLKQLEKNRNQFIKDADAAPVNSDLLGDKAIQVINGEFNKIDIALKKKGADKRRIFDGDSYLGLKKFFDDNALKDNSKYKTAYDIMKLVYEHLGENDTVELFKETPGQSVQAMCIGINSFIKNSVYGGNDYGNELQLMARLAIVSNGTLGYNLPLNEKKDGNYFTETVNTIATTKDFYQDGLKNLSQAKKDIKLPDDFEKNSKNLLNKIVSEAKKLKEKDEKDYESKLKSFDAQFEKKNK